MNNAWAQSQYPLPLHRPRLQQSEARPHTAHASSSPSLNPQEHDFEQQTPRASLAGLGILPEAAERRLSRDDTAADVSQLLPQPGPSLHSKSQLTLPMGQPLNAWPEDSSVAGEGVPPDSQAPLVRPIQPLRFDYPALASQAAFGIQKSQSLGRKFSKGYKDRICGIREGMKTFSTSSRIRRSSTPQNIDSASQASKLTGLTVAPTSPSKRNGRHDSDRPFKQRLQLKTQDRKDTPAPPPNATARPISRHPTAAVVMQGGERARKAAAAFKLSPTFGEVNWDAQEDLNARRSRVGSLSSAADSGADLSYSGSNASCKDSDGDVEMTSCDEAVLLPSHDPLTNLPSEIALQIFEYLDATDLLTVERVHTSWKALAQKTCVWRGAFLREFQRQVYTDPAPIQVGGVGCGRPNKPNQEWKKMYKARVELERNWRQGAKGAGKAIYLAGHTDSVYCLQFDEEKIITGSRDRTIRVWDINNFTCLHVIGGPNVKPTLGPKVLRTVDYPDFHLATASVNGTAYGENIYHVPSQWHDASILCLQYDEEILVTGSSDSDLLVWDIKTYEPIKRLCKHTGGVLDVALDAKHIVSCSKDSRIIVWDRSTYEPKGELTGHRGPVNAVQLRGKYLVSASGDGIARLWDLDQMKLIKEFSAKERGLAAVEFSEDMKYVLAGGNDTITYKFETETGKEVKQFVGHTQLVRSLWLDSQNNRVVSGSYDLDLRVYDFVTGQEIWRAEEWTTSWMLAAKSDYRRIVATSQDGRILIIDFGLQKCRTPDDGQPIANVDLLRGTDNSSAVKWEYIDWNAPSKRKAQLLQEQLRQQNLQAASAAPYGNMHFLGLTSPSPQIDPLD